MRHRGVLVAAAVFVLLAGACSSSDVGDDDDDHAAASTGTTRALTEADDPDSPDPVPIIVRYFRDLAGNIDGGGPLPTTAAEVVAGAELVVVGTVADVDRGVAVDQQPPDGAAQAVVDWDDPGVDFRTVHVDVVADEVVKGDVATGATVPIGLTVYPNIDPGLVADGLRAIGDRVLVFLANEAGPPYDAGRWTVVGMGAFYATVGPGENVNLNFYPDVWPPELRAAMPTLAAVRAAA
jgi:hypothetical protein